MKRNYILAFALFAAFTINAQTVIYSNNFENGVGTATIIGNGIIEATSNAAYGSVFHNAAGGQGVRSNYLLLPANVMANIQAAATNEFTIAFWVNKGTAVDCWFSPIFSVYGAAPIGGVNTWPMMVLQSRLIAQVNNAGWTDLSSADNVTGTNAETSAWLDDAAWHYYTATFTQASVKVYIDGVVKNAWNCNGTDGHTVNGLFSNGSDLKYICLGGNQAWNWNDSDPGYLFDDVAIYSSALTASQINTNITSKITTALQPLNAEPNGQLLKEEFFTTNGSKAGNEYNYLKSGIYIKRAFYSNGAVTNTKIVKTEVR